MDNIKVAIRVRPLIEKEKGLHLQSCWKIQDNTIFTSDSNGRQGTSYTFDHIFDEYETTLDIFEKLCVPIVDSAVQGFHGTIFAYGQSSSGKTFTMSGGSLQKGIIALSVDEIFNKMEMQIDRDFLMRVTYMEIYNEKVTDLLSSEEKSIKIHEDGDRNIQVVGLTESMATSSDDVYKAIQEGDKRRHMAETKQNDRSSRSHCILRMIIESRLKSDEEAVMVAHLNFVDLAGSEKAGENTGDRFREGCSINRSLFSLGVVISKLSNGEGHSHIGFRDSKLTRILQNALGGNSKTAIIATIAPAFLDESHSTLRFASRAKTIKNKPTQNEVLSESAMLKKYQREIRTLQDKLNTLNIIDVKIEKEDLEKRLYEKEEIQRKHEEMIANLQNIIVRRDLSHNGSKAAEKKKRRQTWCPGRKRPSSMRSMVEEEESKDKYKFLDEIPEITFSPPEKRQRSLDTMVLVSPELDAPTQQLMEIQDKYEALLKDHENLKKELSELDTFTALERESLEEQIEKQKEEIQNLYQVSDEALEEYGKMKKEYKRMQTERDVMCDEHCQMEHKYKIQSTRLQDYEKELEALRQDSNMQSKSDEKYSTSQEEVSSLKHTLEEKQSHIDALEKELEAMRTSEKELEAMRTSKKELQQENQTLQENLHHVEQQAEDLKHQLRTLQEDKSRPGTEAEEQEGDGGRGKVDELEQEVQTLKEEKDLLGERLLEEENSHSDLKLAYEDVYNELQEFKDKSAKEEEYSLWKQTLAEKQSHIETLEKELEAMRTSEKELEAVRTSEKELEAVRTSDSSDSDKVTQLQQENQTLQENLHHVEQQAEDLKHQLRTLQEDKSRPGTEAEEQEGDGGRGKVDELEQEVQTLKEEKDLLGERLLEEENSHSDLKLAYEDVYNELQELNALSFKENENSLWKQTLEEKQSHIEALEKELEAMRTSEKELEAVRTSESSDRDKVTQLQQDNQTLQENLHHLEQQAEDLKHQLMALQEDKSRPGTEAEEQEGDGGRGKVDELEQEVQTLKEEKDLLGERLLEEENSHSDLKLAYEDVYNELQELKALSFKEEEYLKCMQTLEEKQSHIVTLERELEAMRTSEKKLEAVRTSDSSDSDKVTQLQQENQTLQENLHHVEQQAEDLKHQLKTLQEDKSRPGTEAEEQEGDGGRGKVDELEQEVQTLKEEKDLLGERLLEEENSHSDLKLAYEDVYNELQEFKDKSAKNKEVSSLRQTLEEKQSHIEALEKELEAMRTSEKELEVVRTSEKEMEAVKTSESSDSDKVTQLQQENQTLQENLHHLEQQAEDLKHQLKTLQEDKCRPCTEAEEQEGDGGRGKVDELEQEVQTLKEEKDLLGERLLEEENSHSDLKLAYEDVYNELQELKALSFNENENVLWKQTLEDKQSHIEALEKELEAMRTEKELEAVRTSEKELEAMRTSESSDRDKVTQLQQENQTLQENLHHVEQQAEDLKHQLRTLQEDKSRPCTEAEEQEGDGGRGKVDELEQEVQTLKEEKDLLGERLLEEENSHSDLKLAYEDVYNELEELKAQYSKERAVGMKMLQELKQQKAALEEQLNDKEVTTSFATVEKDLLEENMLLQDKVKELENMLSSGNMDSSLMALNNQLQEKLKLLESKTDIDQEEALEANMKLQGKIDELTQMLNEKENEEELMQENKHLQSRVIDLEKCSVECEELSENNIQLLKELEDLRKCSVEKSKCLEEENTHLRRKIEELESEMSAAISNLKEVNDELLKKIAKYESANSVKLSESFEIDTNMEEKIFELENAVKDADNLREINLELEQKIMVFKDTILLKDEEINNLNSKLKESCGKNSTKSIEELIEENRCLKEQIEELEANSTLGSSEELVKENRTLQDRIAELESKVSLTGDHEQLYQQFNQIVGVMKEEHNNEMERIKQEWEGQVSEAEEKVKVAEEMVKVSEDITNSTQEKADNLRVKLQAAENEVKILEEKVQIAEEKLLAFEKEESSILSGVKIAEHKASAAEERLKEVEERLQGEVEKNTTEKEQMEAALDKNKQEIEHLLCKIKALEGEIERILLEKGTKDINEETIMTLEHEKSTLKMSIECLEKDKESLLEKINDLVCKTSNWESIVSDLNSQVKHLQDNERLMTAEKEDAEEKLCRLENKISSLENGKTEANLHLQKTESEKSEIIQEKIELSRKNSELMHERDEIAIKLKELIKNYATLEEESEKKCKYLEEERAKLLKTRDLLQEEILCMKKDLSSMKETLSNLSCVKTELEDLKTENGSLRETRQHNIQQVEELEAEKERLAALCSNLKEENTSLMHQCEGLEASATSTHQTQPSESDVLTLKEKLQKLEKELDSTRDISARASRDCSLLHTKLISVKEENGKMKKELAKKNIEMTNLKERLSDAEENISKKSIQIRETEDMYDHRIRKLQLQLRQQEAADSTFIGSLPGLAEPKVTKPVAPSGGVVEHFENYMLEAEVKQLRKTIASNEKKVKEYDRLKQEYEKLRNAYMTERENRKKLQGSIESSVRTPLTDSSNKDLPSTVSSQKKSDITSGSCYPHSGTKNSLSSQEPFTGSKVSTGGSSCSTVGSKDTSSESFIDSGVSGSRYLSGSSVDKLHRSSVDQTQSSSHSGKGSSISAGNNSFRFDGSLSSIYTTDKEATGETSLWHKKPTVPPKLAMSVSKKTEKPKPGQDDNCITQ